ncbi:MAG TPA: methyltransferase [Gracilimonas sp.]|uniref:class I SAM-dependent methyltransferase n=1 Tax=Gracilimonas sp. TaxID=1974203 RepID=UPI002DA63EC1|nr:methyltransferase [Gracilimonas sp.]
MKKFTYREKDYTFRRYPETTNKSLQAWNAGDEYVLAKLEELDVSDKCIAIYNDRFGFLSTILDDNHPIPVVDRKSQLKSIEQNMELNGLTWDSEQSISPLDQLPKTVDIGIITIPKTMDLFKLYLQHVSQALADDGIVICSFMTKYFSPQMLSIAGEFFEEVDQSLAKKKSRILTLKEKKEKTPDPIIEEIPFSFSEDHQEHLKQYPGVFSGGHIDYATQFLIMHLEISKENEMVLDLASGNGVIARAIQIKNPTAEIHLTDDSRLAIASSKLNLSSENTHFHWNDTLDELEKSSFDLVVSNPPFHFGHETNIEVSVKLFQEVAEVLKPDGRFICVANQHLNYKTHLDKIFKTVEVIAQTDKFILYKSME